MRITLFVARLRGLVEHHAATVEAVLETGVEAIVAPSGSCVGSVRHQDAMVARRAGDEGAAARADRVAAQTFGLSELVVDRPVW